MGLSDSEAAYLAGSMFGAGSETTASGITITIMAAACYPEAQRWVQEELDQVLGGERRAFYLSSLSNFQGLMAPCSS